MGYPGQMTHPEVQKVIDAGIRTVVACGKAPGILTHEEKLARHYLSLGTQFIAVASDVVVLARETERIAAFWKQPGAKG